MYKKGRSVHTLNSSEKNFIINSLTKIVMKNEQDLKETEIMNFMLDTGMIAKPINVQMMCETDEV